MRIILARHGNTFAAEDKVVWAGSAEDYPLVEKGIEQANILASALHEKNIIPEKIFTATLQRTRDTAKIVSEKLDVEFQEETRLNEINYGAWGGLTSEEIIEQFGEEQLSAWNNSSLWPQNIWRSEEKVFFNELESFYSELLKTTYKTVLIISSNGRLRYFLKFADQEWTKRIKEQKFKISTGNVSDLYYSDKLEVKAWNISAMDLLQ